MPAVTCIYYLNKGVFENGTYCKGNIEFCSTVPYALIVWRIRGCEEKKYHYFYAPSLSFSPLSLVVWDMLM